MSKQECNKRYREKHKEKQSAYMKDWYQAHKEERRLYNAEYQKAHRKEHNAYKKRQRDIDPLMKMKTSVRNRIGNRFRLMKEHKIVKTEKLLGTTYKLLKEYIESQFIYGMTWDSYGKWHIDHIIPLASAKTIDEIIALCYYTNLQPLWAIDNIQKGKKLQIAEVIEEVEDGNQA